MKRDDIIYYLKRLGFTGPYAGTKHQVMVKQTVRVRIPNPHRGDISIGLLAEILRQAGISRDEWEQL
jgi:predicted RNA binding protein YcfA (HicA-like mRNA interferase family)